MKNTWKVRPVDKNKEEILLKGGRHKLLARLLAQRDIPIDEVDSFLSLSYNDLSHPYALKGVEESVNLFIQCALKKQKVLIVGDYDCDGVISGVMLSELCKVFQMPSKVFLPSRYEHGYGLTSKTVESIKEISKEFKPDLLIVADSGSNNEEEIKDLKDFGIPKIIIIDHHIVEPDKMSKSADVLMNWRLSDYQDMCACGQIFQFIRGIRWKTKKVDPIEFLSYAAIGTLADVIPIIKDNRIIVSHGLGAYALSHVVASGLISLLRHVYIYNADISQQDILFKIAPRINAAGRMKDPQMAYRLLIEENSEVAESIAEELNICNEKRRGLQKKIEREARGIVESDLEKYEHGIALFNPDWSIGVVGIVAAQLAEKFLKPVVIVGESNGIYKGSGRSIGNIDLSKILDNCSDLFDGYGGHPLAAGVTLKKDKVDEFNVIFNEACKKYYDTNEVRGKVRYYDIELKPKGASLKVAEALKKTIYPYSDHINPEPIFLLSDVTITNVNLIGKAGRAATFSVVKDGEEIPMQMKIFYPESGTEMEGWKVDVYFTFPQVLEADRFGDPALTVIDIFMKK